MQSRISAAHVVCPSPNALFGVWGSAWQRRGLPPLQPPKSRDRQVPAKREEASVSGRIPQLFKYRSFARSATANSLQGRWLGHLSRPWMGGLARSRNPIALHLRAMNMLYEGLKQNSTIVVVPSTAIESMQLGGLAGITALTMGLGKDGRDNDAMDAAHT